jgi:NAD dependent epimerase/dehydratase family enzyme
MKIIYGEMADIILKGSRVSSEKIRNAGFSFEFENLKKALDNIFISRRSAFLQS